MPTLECPGCNGSGTIPRLVGPGSVELEVHEVCYGTGRIGMMDNLTLATLETGIMDDVTLATLIDHLDTKIKGLQNERGHVEQELTRRLQERGARELAHPTLEVKLVYPSPTYETAKLMVLAEIIPPEDYNKAYQPAWVKEVPQAARFDGRQLNTLARKYGEPVQKVLDQARLPSAPKLDVKPKVTETLIEKE